MAKTIDQPDIACPEGSTPRSEGGALVCMLPLERPAQKTCPVSQVLIGDMCVERIAAPPEMRCPPGFFEDLHTGRCFTAEETPQRDFCPVGFKLVNEQCLRQERHPLVPICPPGYQVSHGPTGVTQCTKETIVPFMKICAFGFTLENDICTAKKLQYEFDEAPEEQPAPEESNLPLNTPDMPRSEEKPEPTIEVTVNRPVVQKGLVMRNEPVVLSGPASEVAKKQAIIQAGGDLKDVKDLDIEYVPPQPSQTNAANIAALLATMGGQ